MINPISPCPARTCTAQVRYANLGGTGQVPLDLDMTADGELLPDVDAGGARAVRARRPGERGRGFVLHWMTCRDPGHWSKSRRHHDGSATGVPRPYGSGGVPLGPCAGCRRPDHVAYGPTCRGLLCDDCSNILERWRATPHPRGPLTYPMWAR